MKKSKVHVLISLSVLTVVSCIAIYAGHFIFKGQKNVNNKNEVAESTSPSGDINFPVQFKHQSISVNGNKQEVNIIEIDPGDSRIEIKPVLSFDSVFGFEKLSSMVSRTGAYAATNAGFFYEYGLPAGMVAIDGEIIRKPSGKYPVFFISHGKAQLRELNTDIYLACKGKRIEIDDINVPGSPGKGVVYTHKYDTENRAKTRNATLTVVDELVKRKDEHEGSSGIPEKGMLLTLFNPIPDAFKNFSIHEGDKADVIFEPDMGNDLQAYECGSWLLRDGKVVIKERDEWIGVMTNNDPRTAVGIMNDGKIILMTVDGRQPGYSAGLTGSELADFMLDYGVKDAAMLDGGASTEMIINGKIVNKPSFKGQERPLGGAIVIKYSPK